MGVGGVREWGSGGVGGGWGRSEGVRVRSLKWVVGGVRYGVVTHFPFNHSPQVTHFGYCTGWGATGYWAHNV